MNEQNLKPNLDLGKESKGRSSGGKKLAKQNHLRKWWKEEFLNMSEKQIEKYINNPKNPYLNRVYAKMFLSEADLDSYYKLANQCYGQPSQSIEVSGLPKLDLSVFGEEDDDEDKSEVC